jgi:hypothetical protein
MPVIYIVTLFIFILIAAVLFKRFQSKYMLGENAPEMKTEVTILDKQIIEITDTQPGEEGQEFWIYVQKGNFGPKREFEVGIHFFNALNPGDKGIMTYQGRKFHHFALKRD